MNTWLAILIILGALIIGSVAGFLTIRMIARRKQNQDNSSPVNMKNQISAPSQKSATPEIDSKNSALLEQKLNNLPVNPAHDRLELLMEERKKAIPPLKSVRTEYTGILAELINNLSIATTPVNGRLLLFQTKYWDNNHDTSEKLINNYKEELTQAYTDIRLANVIVWLSNDLGHTSPELEKSYVQLCTKIAGRLNDIVTAQIADKD